MLREVLLNKSDTSIQQIVEHRSVWKTLVCLMSLPDIFPQCTRKLAQITRAVYFPLN